MFGRQSQIALKTTIKKKANALLEEPIDFDPAVSFFKEKKKKRKSSLPKKTRDDPLEERIRRLENF